MLTGRNFKPEFEYVLNNLQVRTEIYGYKYTMLETEVSIQVFAEIVSVQTDRRTKAQYVDDYIMTNMWNLIHCLYKGTPC